MPVIRDECSCGRTKDNRARQCVHCYRREPSNKTCNGCGETFPIEAYSLRPNGKGGFKRRSRCRSCESRAARQFAISHPERIRKAKRSYEAKNPHKTRKWALRATWKKKGYDPDEVERFVAEHHGRCDICGAMPQGKRLSIDHDHRTGQLRGLLCSDCNFGLGQFRDNPELLQRAAHYLIERRSGIGPDCEGRENQNIAGKLI